MTYIFAIISLCFQNMGIHKFNVLQNCQLGHYPLKPWYSNWIFSEKSTQFCLLKPSLVLRLNETCDYENFSSIRLYFCIKVTDCNVKKLCCNLQPFIYNEQFLLHLFTPCNRGPSVIKYDTADVSHVGDYDSDWLNQALSQHKGRSIITSHITRTCANDSIICERKIFFNYVFN